MTIRPLPDIDLARIAPQPDQMKRKSLERFKLFGPKVTYQAFRARFHDLLNIQPEMFGPAPPTKWAVIEANIKGDTTSEQAEQANLQVARGLYRFAVESDITGRVHEFFPLSMSIGQKVNLWLPMIVAIEGKAYAIFIDPRRSNGLTKDARRFVFSMMHERIRAADPDFADIGLGIVRFANSSGDERAVRLYTDDGIQLYSLEELEVMVASTYEIWREVVEERERDVRSRATGTGPLI